VGTVYVPISDNDPEIPDQVHDLRRTLRGSAPFPKRTVALDLLPHRGRRLSLGDEASFALAEGPAGDGAVAAIEVPVLDHWSVQAHTYTENEAAKVGLLGGLFGGSGKHAKAGAIHEAKRWSVVEHNGVTQQVGVAVRLAAATSDWEGNFDLTLPNIAASASLEHKDARVGMDVVGYNGPLGSMLPAPKQLDVTTLADYLTAFDKIQSMVFGDAGLQFLAPTVISYEAPDEPPAKQQQGQ